VATVTVDSVVLDAVTPALRGLGFRKRAGSIFTMDVCPGVLGWLGLNRATRHEPAGEAEVNPVVGVRWQEIERVVAQCRGEVFHAYLPPTLSTPLGYLLSEPKYKSWRFTAANASETAAAVAAAVARHGLPFMRSLAEATELSRRMVGGLGIEQQLIYRRPIALLLAGSAASAREDLESSVASLGRRSDLAAEEFRRFACALRLHYRW
jgi:hypothetical protein